MISYAQAREDVILHRALHHVHFSHGFYIDVGGYHPSLDSVTKHFYDHGWHGINIEPAPALFAPFVQERTRDINLNVAVSDVDGEVTFHEVEGQLGTLVDRFADRHEKAGFSRTSYTVPCQTLSNICERHVGERDIHFLKIDIEGHEAAALRGLDLTKYRPWVMVIEAAEPNNLSVPTYQDWEPALVNAGYDFVHADVLNRYYVRKESAHLAPAFAVAVDDYIYARCVNRVQELEHELSVLKSVRS